MVLFFRIITRLFGKSSGIKGGKAGQAGEPIKCLGCGRTFAVKKFPATNGVCKCNGDDFSFKTDEISDAELAANKNLSDGAKFVLDADDQHIDTINGRKLIGYLRNQGLL